MNGRRLQFGVAVIDNKLYVVGGRDGLKTSNTVECYDPLTKVWSNMPPMSTHRHGLGTSSFSNVFFLSFNYNFTHILTSVVWWEMDLLYSIKGLAIQLLSLYNISVGREHSGFFLIFQHHVSSSNLSVWQPGKAFHMLKFWHILLRIFLKITTDSWCLIANWTD